jgi:hypothetical protein
MSLKYTRESVLTAGLNLSSPGLEVSPLYRPTVKKPMYKVFYTDYCTADESREKHSSYKHDEIMDLDFVWTPNKRLVECVDPGLRFDWAISSHVMEHVPNPIGWLLQIFEVMNEGATYSIALPHKKYCFDKFRRDTDSATLIDAWIRDQSIPSPYQIFEFLSRSIEMGTEAGDKAYKTATSLEEAKRHYTDVDALNFTSHSWASGSYIDVHCSAFTPESFVQIFKQIHDLGILNIEISDPILGPDEFFVKLKKIGEPRTVHPGAGFNAKASVIDQSQNNTEVDLKSEIENLLIEKNQALANIVQLSKNITVQEALSESLQLRAAELLATKTQIELEKTQLQTKLDQTLDNHNKIKSSVSWKITKPIRAIGRLLRQ